MTATAAHVPLHDQRLRLVAGALLRHSDLPDDVAFALAGHVLDTLDHVPETVR